MENNISVNIASINSDNFREIQYGGDLTSPQLIVIISIALIVLFFILKWTVDYFFYGVDNKINDLEKKVKDFQEEKINDFTKNLKKIVDIGNYKKLNDIKSESSEILNNINNLKTDKIMQGLLENTKTGLTNLMNLENKTQSEKLNILNNNYQNISKEIKILSKQVNQIIDEPPQQLPPLPPQQLPPPPQQLPSQENMGPIIYDPIETYDYKKLNDPLIDPRGRTSADEIPTPIVAAQLNFPTQGILDRYHRVGLLICANDHEINSFPSRHRRKKDLITANGSNMSIDSVTSVDTNSLSSNNSNDIRINKKNKGQKIIITSDDNNILELIGKKITDNWYRYFTSISMGNKIIKIVVHNRNRRELYDGDLVFIKELNKWYKVKLDDLDMIEYNPYFF